MKSEILTLGGRRFRPVAQGTVRHDHWVMARVRRTEIDSLPKAENESARDYAVRLLEAVMKSDGFLELAGGLLVPEEIADVDWTPEIAHATSTFIGGLTDPDDKLAVEQLTVMVIVPFLESGLVSSSGSETSSDSSPDRDDAPSRSGPAMSSASGAFSFDRSESSTPTGPGASSIAGP